MRKTFICILMVLMIGLLVVPVAYANNTYTHGDFATNSKGCADCHITHGANAAKLLVAGPTQTDTCYFCHSESQMSSRYNVETGTIMGTDSVERPSYAGGFKQSANPGDWTVATGLVDNTSVHSVEAAFQTGLIQAGQASGKDIPGGPSGWTSAFTCGSCHDPHAGGPYPAVAPNPRLLKLRPNNVGSDRVVKMYINFDTSAGDTQNKDLLPTEYGLGFDGWCGACHDVFNTETTGAAATERSGSNGITNGAVMKYRHKMGVKVTSTVHAGFKTSLKDGLPLGTNTDGTAPGASQNYLMCLTCHRAHGSSVTVSVGFKRFKSYDTIYAGTQDTIAVADGASALLRLPERDACYMCHGAAQYNKYNNFATDYATGK